MNSIFYIQENNPTGSFPTPSGVQAFLIQNSKSQTAVNVPIGNKTISVPYGEGIWENYYQPNSISSWSTTAQMQTIIKNFCGSVGGSYFVASGGYPSCGNLPSSLGYSAKATATAMNAPNANLYNN